MLPREIWSDGRKIKLPSLRHGSPNYDYLMYRARYEVTHCLERWLKVPLDYGQTFLPAAMMLNSYEGPVWMHSDQKQEIGDIRKVVKQAHTARKLAKKAVKFEHAKKQREADVELACALNLMKDLPPPVSLWIENSTCRTSSEWAELFDHIHSLFSEYIYERGGDSGHLRARTVAIVVRAAFEVHSEEGITLGITEQVPEGDYGKCVQEVFSWAGVPVNFYRYAREARNLTVDDPLLLKYVKVLQENYSEQPSPPQGPIVYEVR